MGSGVRKLLIGTLFFLKVLSADVLGAGGPPRP